MAVMERREIKDPQALMAIQVVWDCLVHVVLQVLQETPEDLEQQDHREIEVWTDNDISLF